jgi:hypothetical protein
MDDGAANGRRARIPSGGGELARLALTAAFVVAAASAAAPAASAAAPAASAAPATSPAALRPPALVRAGCRGQPLAGMTRALKSSAAPFQNT